MLFLKNRRRRNLPQRVSRLRSKISIRECIFKISSIITEEFKKHIICALTNPTTSEEHYGCTSKNRPKPYVQRVFPTAEQV